MYKNSNIESNSTNNHPNELSETLSKADGKEKEIWEYLKTELPEWLSEYLNVLYWRESLGKNMNEIVDFLLKNLNKKVWIEWHEYWFYTCDGDFPDEKVEASWEYDQFYEIKDKSRGEISINFAVDSKTNNFYMSTVSNINGKPLIIEKSSHKFELKHHNPSKENLNKVGLFVKMELQNKVLKEQNELMVDILTDIDGIKWSWKTRRRTGLIFEHEKY